MTLPKWADEQISAQLHDLREQGEGQKLEFKESFPEQAHRLAEEVAAFATCGGGTILIGVHDNGDVAGLNAASEEERDDLIHRAQGIIRTVRPQVKYEIRLGCDEGELILVVEIEEQEQPVFYYDYRPYIRDGRMSRRAEPEEVKERVWAHPSSEYQRQMEQLKVQQMRDHQEHMKAISQSSSDLTRQLRQSYIRRTDPDQG
jgi:predicted HTH transcriptional regulator